MARNDGVKAKGSGQRGSPGKWSTRRHQAGRSEAPRTSGGGRRETVGASGNFVIGRNAARELLRHSPKRLVTAHVARAHDAGSSPIENELHTLLKAAGIEPQVSAFDQLTRMAGSDSHQGWVLEVAPRPNIELKELLASLEDTQESLLVLLDSVEDPHNVGSILRAAECFGADAVIFSRNRGASITPSVTKASAGASELVAIAEVSNLHDAIEKCRRAGWWIIGAEAREGSRDLSTYQFAQKVALVVGAEGQGLHALTRKSLDEAVFIPMRGKIDSLNVGQAAAVLMAAYRGAASGHVKK
jgi:23S rRNA (guanosine2251-2'-O)-methyltransferase